MCKIGGDVSELLIRNGFRILTTNIWIGICAGAVRSMSDIDQLS